MKPIGVKSSRYNDFNPEHNDTYPKFKADGHVRISKQQNIFAKAYTPNQVVGICIRNL